MATAHGASPTAAAHPRGQIPRRLAGVLAGALLEPAALVGAAGAVSLLAAMLTGFYLSRLLGPELYGRVCVLLNEYLLLSLVSGFGLTVGATAGTAHPAGNTARHDWGALVTLRLATLALPLSLGSVWAVVAGDPLHLAVAVCTCLAMVQDFFVGALQGLGRFRVVTAILAGQPLLFLGLVWVLVGRGGDDVALVIGTMSASFLVAGAGALWYAVGGGLGIRVRSLRWPEVRGLLGTNTQFQLVTFLQFGYAALPLVLLGQHGRYTDVALLSISLTLVRLVPAAMGPLLGGYYYARLCRSRARGDMGESDDLIRLFSQGMTVVGAGAFAGLWAFPEVAIRVLYSDQYLDAAPTLALMAGLGLVLALESVVTWTLIAHRRTMHAVAALAVRLCIVLVGVGAFAFGLPPSSTLSMVGATYLLASLVGLGLALRALPAPSRAAVGSARIAAAALGVLLLGVGLHLVVPDGADVPLSVAGLTVGATMIGAGLLAVGPAALRHPLRAVRGGFASYTTDAARQDSRL